MPSRMGLLNTMIVIMQREKIPPTPKRVVDMKLKYVMENPNF